MTLHEISNGVENNHIFPNSGLSCTIRNARRDEILKICEWRNMNYVHRGHVEYLLLIFDYDPSAWYVAIDDKTQEIIGAIAGIHFKPNIVFAGFWAVKERYQNRGIGRKLWNIAIGASDSKAYIVALNALVAGVEPNIRKGLIPHFTSKRFTGQITQGIVQDIRALLSEPIDLQCELHRINSHNLKDSSALVEALIKYDASIQTVSPRPFFIQEVIRRLPNLITILALPRGSRIGSMDKSLLGYGMLRPIIGGYNIGPVYAENPQIGLSLLLSLLRFLVNTDDDVEVMIVTDQDQNDWREKTGDFANIDSSLVCQTLVKNLELKYSFNRMYSQGHCIDLPLHKVYALTGSETFMV